MTHFIAFEAEKLKKHFKKKPFYRKQMVDTTIHLTLQLSNGHQPHQKSGKCQTFIKAIATCDDERR